MSIIGRKVRELREEQHLLQADLAERAGISRNTVSRIELGHHLPASDTIEKLAQALQVDVGVFFPKVVSLRDFDIEAFLLEIHTEEPDLTRREALEIAFERFTERFKNMPAATLRAYAAALREKQRTLRDPQNFDEYMRVRETRDFIELAIMAIERELAGSRG
jgi:transcriptional regulator with XRE-family HTH domain